MGVYSVFREKSSAPGRGQHGVHSVPPPPAQSAPAAWRRSFKAFSAGMVLPRAVHRGS